MFNQVDAGWKEAAELLKQLRQARQIITDAFCAMGLEGQHAHDCEAARFTRKNQHCPANHPVWEHQPKCTCWVGRAAEFLRDWSDPCL